MQNKQTSKQQTNNQTTKLGIGLILFHGYSGSQKHTCVVFPHSTCTVKNGSILSPKVFMRKKIVHSVVLNQDISLYLSVLK